MITAVSLNPSIDRTLTVDGFVPGGLNRIVDKRDVAAGKPISVPENYYPGNDPSALPLVTWRAHANLLFCNWLNYFVYQTTPYDLSMIPEGGGTEDEKNT